MIGLLIIGFVGSLHCLGMCGPLMMTFTNSQKSRQSFFIYHIGRITSYAFIGLVLGLIGESIQLFRLQQIVTGGLGISLLLIYTIPRFRNAVGRIYFNSKLHSVVMRLFNKNLSMGKKWFIAGLANGLIPCGLTYVAVATSLASGHLLSSTMAMLFFGLGTMPAFVITAVGKQKLMSVKFLAPKVIPVIAVVSGSILVLRSLLLSFPDFNNMVATKAAGLITICGI